MVIILLFFLGFFIEVKASLPHPDLITRLPGQPQVGFSQFSGYVSVDDKKQKALFYYFVEAEVDAALKPLVLWLNGGIYMQKFSFFLEPTLKNSSKSYLFQFSWCVFEGPGCSSLGVGAFSENGPFRPNGQVLLRNEYSWNRGMN